MRTMESNGYIWQVAMISVPPKETASLIQLNYITNQVAISVVKHTHYHIKFFQPEVQFEYYKIQ